MDFEQKFGFAVQIFAARMVRTGGSPMGAPPLSVDDIAKGIAEAFQAVEKAETKLRGEPRIS